MKDWGESDHDIFYSTGPISISVFNFNLFCIHLIHRGYDPLDMELVNTEIKLQILYMK